MALVPLDIATIGYLDSPLSVAVDGYLSLGQGSVGGGGWGSGRRRRYPPLERWKSPIVELDELQSLLELQVEREDEEIIAIILAAMRAIE
jgi:hypothetical protein